MPPRLPRHSGDSFIPHDVKEFILSSVRYGDHAPSVADLTGSLQRKFSCPRKDARRLITAAVKERHIEYRDRFGRPVLAPSLHHPVMISPRIILAGPDTPAPPPGDHQPPLLRLHPGDAFGGGFHPTTRLCLEMIDDLVRPDRFPENGKVLDMGTGSGILALACLRLGASGAMGVDTDLHARREAEANRDLNGFHSVFKIQSALTEEDRQPAWDLITANLRWPTLQEMAPVLATLTTASGAILISGIYLDEIKKAGEELPDFYIEKKRESGRWGCMLFRKALAAFSD
ncbi:MAG: hypothetical protein CSB33_00690 [Desulfobacterales bacterium]|nr:MAG: hypothetical protein CSB33_00690 [Desulfobacterales bacterium]